MSTLLSKLKVVRGELGRPVGLAEAPRSPLEDPVTAAREVGQAEVRPAGVGQANRPWSRSPRRSSRHPAPWRHNVYRT